MAFENDVKTYGTQTPTELIELEEEFENDVKTYGTQTVDLEGATDGQFENDVKTYGTQTFGNITRNGECLRMM